MFESIILPLNDFKARTRVVQCLRFLRKSQFWSEDKIREFQEKKMKFLIRFADKTVPYYHRLFKKHKIDITRISSAEDLKTIPPLNKEIVRCKFKDLLSISRKKHHTQRGRTGGSTGHPLQFIRDKISKSWAWGSMSRHWEWTGMRIGEQRLALAGGSLGGFLEKETISNRIKSFWTNEVLFPAFQLSSINLEILCKWIQDSKIRFIRGYPSTLQIIANFMLKNGYEAPNIITCQTTAERLFDFQREVIEKAFSAKVYDQYGCSEIYALAAQCEEASHYHIFDEHVIIEKPAVENRTMYPSRITDLDSFAMPFIRYENGDVLEFDTSRCSCGRSLSTIKRIIGRTHDFIRATDGTLIPGEFIPHLFQVVRGFNEYFVHQQDQNYVEVQIIPNSSFSESEIEDLKRVIRKHLGKGMKIEFRKVKEIPRPISEKSIFVRSEVASQYFV